MSAAGGGGALRQWRVAIRGRPSGARAGELVDFVAYVDIHPVAIEPSCSVQRGALGVTFGVLANNADEADQLARRIWADVTSLEIATIEISPNE
jgi:hypothetical protein